MSVEEQKKSQVSIDELLNDAPQNLEFNLISKGTDLSKQFIDSARIQKLGLAFAGYDNYLHSGRIQIIGQSEISYLSQLDVKAKSRAIDSLKLTNTNFVLVTNNLDLPTKLLERFKSEDIPVVTTPLVSSLTISTLSRYLQNTLAPTMMIHGVLLGMFGLGILILGKSGIGKSECALDLVRSGHRLISDDSVIIKKIRDFLDGSSPELTYEHLEIRGLGILNIKDLFGVTAIGQNTKINLCIELESWDKVSNIDRLGLLQQEKEIFDIKVPKFVLPVSSGRNISTLVETAVRVHLLKMEGHDATQNIIKKHDQIVNEK